MHNQSTWIGGEQSKIVAITQSHEERNPKFICVTRHMLHDGVGRWRSAVEFGPGVTILRYANYTQ